MLDALNRNSATAFLYIVGAVFVAVMAYQIVVNQPINTNAIYYVTLVILQAVHQQGVTQGVTTTNDTIAKVAAAVPAATKGATGLTGPAGPAGPTGGV